MRKGGVQIQGPTELFPRRKGLNGTQEGELLSQNAAWAKVGCWKGDAKGIW